MSRREGETWDEWVDRALADPDRPGELRPAPPALVEAIRRAGREDAAS